MSELFAEIRKAIIKELNGRSGFDDWWGQIDNEIKLEIENELDQIISLQIKALEGVVEAAKRLERLYQLDTEYFEDRPGTLGYVTGCIIEALKKLEEV